MPFHYEEFDLSGVRTYPLKSRPSKARVEDFARPVGASPSVGELLDSLPNMLAAADLKAVAEGCRESGTQRGRRRLGAWRARHQDRSWACTDRLDGTRIRVRHRDQRRRRSSTTSRSPSRVPPPRTSTRRSAQARSAWRTKPAASSTEPSTTASLEGLGIGQAVSRYLHERSPQHARSSVLAAAGRLGVPVTVHVAIGTDIIHMHPAASGAALGEGSLRDFRYFVSNVARLERGVFLNCGSAVVLPEVFLKAVALARNRGIALDQLTTVNLDFIRGYRPQTNVVSRPTAGTGGKGYSLVGHHEIMIPLLAAAILHAARSL